MREGSLSTGMAKPLKEFSQDASDDRFPLVNRIDHVAILVKDGDRSAAYFRDELKLRLVHDETLGHTGSRLIYFDAGSAFVQLVQPVGPGSVADYLAEHGEGLHHICFATEDIQRVLDSLPSESDSVIFQGGRNRRACFLTHEPSRAKIELTEENPVSQ